MQPDPWQRWSPLAGVAYVILFLVALGVSGDGPGDTPEEVTRYFADDGNRSASSSSSSSSSPPRSRSSGSWARSGASSCAPSGSRRAGRRSPSGPV